VAWPASARRSSLPSQLRDGRRGDGVLRSNAATLSAGLVALVVVLGILLGTNASAQSDKRQAPKNGVTVEPDRIGVDLFYGGAAPRVHATVPAGDQVVVRLMGKRERVELKTKGKVGGVLWMNVGEVALESVPTAYLVATSVPLAELAPEPELDRFDVGYAALARHAGPDAAAFRQFVKLKKQEGVYRVDEGAVSLQPTGAKQATLSVSIPLPARSPVGDYKVEVIGFDHGRGHEIGTASLRLEHAGLVRTLRSLAVNRSLIYGFAAVFVAIVAGVLTGLIFGRRAGGPH
jgi:uncharacterized protein (TIGR02186 family)